MKRLLYILILFCPLAGVAQNTVWNLITNSQVVVCNFEASYDQPYFYHGIWMPAALALMRQDITLRWRNCAASGRSLQGHNEISIPSMGVPHWGNASHQGAEYFGIIEEGGNGGYTPFQVMTNLTNTIQAPLTTFNGSFYTNQPGWCSTSHVFWIGQGDIPGDQADGQTVYRDGNDALTNFFGLHGLPYVDEWNPLYVGGWSNDVVSGANLIRWFPNSHPGPPGQGNMTVNRLLQWGFPTNIYALDLDWNNGLVTSTNHCTATSASKSGNTFTFTFRAGRLGMPIDSPDGVCTNDATEFSDIIPAQANAFMEIWRITNLPVGNYLVTEDGSNTAVVASTVLAGGWNRWLLTNGWEHAQKRAVVNGLYDLIGADHTTLAQHSAGSQGVNGGPDIVNFFSYSGGFFTTNNGPAIIADLNFIETNLDALDIPIHTAAQQTNHTITISYIAPRYVGAIAGNDLPQGQYALLVPTSNDWWHVVYSPGLNPSNYNWKVATATALRGKSNFVDEATEMDGSTIVVHQNNRPALFTLLYGEPL